MFDYLYYRFYRLWLKSSIAEGAVIMAILSFSVMLTTNILTVWGILVQYSLISYPSDCEYWILFSIIIGVVFVYLFFKGKYKKIVDKYKQEQRDLFGNIILLLYVSIYSVECNLPAM